MLMIFYSLCQTWKNYNKHLTSAKNMEFDELDYEDINLIIGPKIKELSKHITNGISDSIRTCLDNINNKE